MQHQQLEPRIRWAADHEPRHARVIGQGWPGDYDPEEEQTASLQALEQETGQDDRLLTALCVALPIAAILWFAARAVVEAW